MEAERSLPTQPLDFLWLELTSRCNLRCTHCYADSGPTTSTIGELTLEDYRTILDEGASLGCRKVQFIGGEPTLNPGLPALISHARSSGYEFIEVFTNAVRLSDPVLSCFVDHQVAVATSFYCDDPIIHDRITRRRGSHAATVRTMQRLLREGIELRAGVIAMEDNASRVEETIAFLTDLGVSQVGTDRVRAFGRGADLLSENECDSLGELCGNCWRGSACVSADGKVAPCIMAKSWSAGSLHAETFAAIAEGEPLHVIRERIYADVWLRDRSNLEEGGRSPDVDACNPCNPMCNPSCGPSCNPRCSPNCSPCYPSGKCDPRIFR